MIADVSEAQGLALRKFSKDELLEFARRKTSKWFATTSALIDATTECWGTALYDRDDMLVYSKSRHGKGQRNLPRHLSPVTVLGDACVILF
jgi:hypothetical protein